jgi:uncharacterized protein
MMKSVLAAPLAALIAVAGSIPARGEMVPVDSVRIGGEIGRRIEVTITNNLLLQDWEGLWLSPFRTKTWDSDVSRRYEGYVGLGKTLEALLRMAKYSGDPKLIAEKRRLIGELIATQEPGGYLGCFRPERRAIVYWDHHESVYIIQMLLTDYELFGEKKSLETARRMADEILARRKPKGLPDSVGKLNTERALILLSRVTGDRKYRDYAAEGADLFTWRGPIVGHVYTYINLCLAQLDLYRETGDAGLLETSHDLMDFMLRRNGMVISGTSSVGEGFGDNQDLRGKLGESCVTAYLLRLAHHLLQLEEKQVCGDLMERSIFNALFAAQSPDGRRLRYFTCLEGPRAYFDKEHYCCPGNWRRIVSELPRMIYYTNPAGLTVNLYTRSSATLRTGDNTVAVRQETDYPSSDSVAVFLDPQVATSMTVRLRMPGWCSRPVASVNGKPVRGVKPGEWLDVKRVWRRGDRIDLRFPMAPRLVRGRALQDGRAAVMCGPLVYGLNPAIQEWNSGAVTNVLSGTNTAAHTAWLRELAIDPASIQGPLTSNAFRTVSTVIRARAWSKNADRARPPDLALVLTELPDPGNEATYFLFSDTAGFVEDELSRP